MKQLALPGLPPPPPPSEDHAREEPAPLEPEVDDRQIELFADRIVLGRELELAIGRGAFEDALRVRRRIEETYGPSPRLDELAFLDRMANARWEHPALALSVWTAVEEDLRPRPELRRQARNGVFTRLLARHHPDALAAAWPACLPDLATVLAARAEVPEEGRRHARDLVRDALLAGHPLPGLEFEADEP